MSPNPLPLLAVVVLGFLVGIAGHLYDSKTAILTGIALVLLGSLGLPLVLHFTGG